MSLALVLGMLMLLEEWEPCNSRAVEVRPFFPLSTRFYDVSWICTGCDWHFTRRED